MIRLVSFHAFISLLLALCAVIIVPQGYAIPIIDRLFQEKEDPFDIEALEKSTIKVLAYGTRNGKFSAGTGTGIVINDAGVILTNAHVVGMNFPKQRQDGTVTYDKWDYPFFFVAGPNSTNHLKAELIWSDHEYDLAILRAALPVGEPAILATELPQRADTIRAVGFPSAADVLAQQKDLARDVLENFIANKLHSQSVTVNDGNYSHEKQEPWMPYLTDPRQISILQHSAAINSGNSGGPLFDRCGRVVGVNTAGPSTKVELIGKNPDGTLRFSANAPRGISFASSINEAINVFNEKKIKYTSIGNLCDFDEMDAAQSTNWVLSGISAFSVLLAIVALSRSRAGKKLSSRLIGGSAIAVAPPAHVPAPKAGHPAARISSRNNQSAILSGLNQNGMMVRVEIPASITGADGYVIGRMAELSHYALEDSQTSKRQCRFFWQNGTLQLEDLNSTNPTLVNGQPLSPFRPVNVKSGDQILIGGVKLKLSLKNT